jgi:hypothetical protein
MFVLLVQDIYELCRLYGFMRHDIHNQDWFRYSKVVRGDTQRHTDSVVISQAYLIFSK